MNVNQIVNMVIRLVMRRVLQSGVNAGMNAVGSRMGRGKQKEAGQTAASQQGGPDSRQATKRATQAIRAGRKIGRF